MVRLEYKITSEHPCQIPVLGEFKAGETKELSDETLDMFERVYKYKVGAGNFPPHTRLVVTIVTEDDNEDANEDEEA